jgi:hypothetical protein
MINRDFSKTIKSEGEKSSGKTFEPRYDEKKVYGSKPKSSVPTIYELVKRKEERDKTIVGKDIDIVE